MLRIRNNTLRRTNLMFLVFMGFLVPLVQAEDSLETLQKRKAIAEAEKAAIEAETARDEARKKQSELRAPLDPVPKATDEARGAVNSSKASAEAKKPLSATPSLCVQCLTAAQNKFKACLDAAISHEDKRSCQEKQDTRAKACNDGECVLEMAQGGSSGEVLSGRK